MESEANWGMLGHEWAVDLLKGHLANDRVRHAYLIIGPQGVGKRTLALRMIQGLNCPNSSSPGNPCHQCPTCLRIERMQHPDLSVVQAEEVGRTLKVDQIRELIRGLSLAPYEAPHKIGLLLRFNESNPNAANALLKTLEEPPPKVKLILTALDAESLLPTIVSRCELIPLRPLKVSNVTQGLIDHWNLPAEEAKLLAHVANGRPGHALKLHRNPEMLTQRTALLDDHQTLLAANRVSRFNYAENLAKDKSNFFQTLHIWQSLWRDLLLLTSGASASITNLDREGEIKNLSTQLNLHVAKDFLKTLEQTQKRLEHNTNTRLTAEVLMLNLPQIT